MSDPSHETPILTASVQRPERWWLWVRLQLYIDRLELSGWWGWQHVQRTIPLDRLRRVRAPEEHRLTVHPANQDAVSLRVEDAARWARSIRAFRACLDGPDSHSE